MLSSSSCRAPPTAQTPVPRWCCVTSMSAPSRRLTTSRWSSVSRSPSGSSGLTTDWCLMTWVGRSSIWRWPRATRWQFTISFSQLTCWPAWLGLDAWHILQKREARQISQHHSAQPLRQSLPWWECPLQYTGKLKHLFFIRWNRKQNFSANKAGADWWRQNNINEINKM